MTATRDFVRSLRSKRWRTADLQLGFHFRQLHEGRALHQHHQLGR